MELQFDITESDYRQFSSYVWRRSMRKRWPILALLIVLWAGIGVIGLRDGNLFVTRVYGSIVLVWLGAWALGYYLRVQMATKQAREELRVSSRRTANIDRSIIKYYSTNRSSGLRWPAIVSLERTRDIIYLFTGPSTALFIPRRAFSGREEFDQSFAEIERLRSLPPTPVTSSDRPDIPVAPGQLTVTFQYSLNDLSLMMPYLSRLSTSRQQRWLGIALFPVVVLSLGIGLQWRTIVYDANYMAAVAPAAIALLYLILITVASRPRELAARQLMSPALRIPQTLTASEDWLLLDSANGWTLYQWAQVVSVSSNKAGIYIAVSKRTAIAIPSSTFRDAQEQAYFAESVERYWKGLGALEPPAESKAGSPATWPPAPSSIGRNS